MSRRLGLGGKLTLGFGALACVTLLVVALVFVAGRRVTADIDLTEGVRRPASLASTQAQANLLRMQLHVRGYLVLSDPHDIEQYHEARRSFEASLSALQAMAGTWPEADAAASVNALTEGYGRWAKLPPQLFELHDNPLKNRPALRLARVEVQSRRVSILEGINSIIELQEARISDAVQREVLADLLGFQTSFDAMATNLMAYGTSGELSFKLAYGPQLATNAAHWNALVARRTQLTAEQRAVLDTIARQRAEIAELALRIVAILNSERAFEDLYLYRTEVGPQAQTLIDLLAQLTDLQQKQLGSGLARARDSLAGARLFAMGGGALAIAVAVAMAFGFRRHVVGPVHRLTGVAEQVAAGRLTARAAVESNDEIGVLAASINTMTQRLADTIEHLEAVFEQAQRARDAAEVANRAKSSFLANMSHELRTPLNAVLGYAQILQREPALTERQRNAVDTIRRGGEHLLVLIDGVLDVARIEAGKVELYTEAIELPALLQLVNGIIRVSAEQKGLLYVCEATPPPPAVHADGKRLEQVLLNLLGNAVKFTEHGQVTLRVRHCPAADPARVRVSFAVMDTGIGIAPAQRENLFRPFEQASDVQRRYGGTGLGLAISQQLVGLMGGRIEVESMPGNGSVFSFELELPLAAIGAPAAAAPMPPRRITGYAGKRRRILIVDDVAAHRSALADFLAPLGFDLHQADDGEAGVQQAKALRPDLILMDNVMPVMDGLQAMRRLRELPQLRSVPIIAVSASATLADQQNSLSGGATAFLSKPIDFDALLAEIGGLLHLRWTPGAPDASEAFASEATLPQPDPAAVAELKELARIGNMRSIRDYADRLAASDPRFEALAQRLRALADSFQSRALAELAQRFERDGVMREEQP
jgi:signal transduction histidine kinase/DNA-binding NarL/FixJ family response regulator